MSRKFSKLPEYIKYLRGSKDLENDVESYLVNLEKLDSKRFAFWQDYWTYLYQEREKRLDDILEAIDSSKIRNVELNHGSRVVVSDYSNDPLCTVGSVRKLSGGRFNFGNISSYHKPFHCLYVANSFETAYAEVFHYNVGEAIGDGNLTPEEMQSHFPGSFSHNEIKAELDSAIDLTSDESLRPFLRVISTIKPSASLISRAKQLNLGKVRTTQTIEALKKTIFDEKYVQWGVWINEPANSQWFGHYTRLAGVQGIIYPSCRAEGGVNYAIFPDTLENTDACVSLVGNFPHVLEGRRQMNKDNFWDFEQGSSVSEGAGVQ